VITWIAGHGDPEGRCDLQITLDASGGVIVDQRFQGWTRGAELWRDGPATFTVETDCSWSVHVGAG
jgi:hypothetical protein